MAQLFPRRANVIVRTVLVALAYCGVAVPFWVWAYARTPAATGQYRAYRQPVPFPHNLHVSGLRIDCRYCHAGAERAAMAGLPPTHACVPCHHDATLASNLFARVRASLATGQPIAWRRVTRVHFYAPLVGACGSLADAATLTVDEVSIAVTTDSFVVRPLRFPGGSIGDLAVKEPSTTLPWPARFPSRSCAV